MIRRYVVLSALAAFVVMVASGIHGAEAAKPSPSGTIAIASGYTPALGQPLAFDYTVSDMPGGAQPRIQVLCYQGGELVYGEARAADPSEPINAQPFDPLGGAASVWLTNGGPASCEATLYYWQFHPSQVFHPLATVEFEAGG